MKRFKQTFPNFYRLPRSGKFLAWFNLLGGIHWLGATAIHALVSPETLYWPLALSVCLFGVLNLVSAWQIFQYRRSGFYLALPIYFLALFQLETPVFWFDLAGVLKLSFGFGWIDGWKVMLNVLAVVWLVFAIRNIRRFGRAET